MADQSNTPGAEAARLRADIDSGRTADKIPVSDPAASPLGTDDEAAGVTNSAAEIAAAREGSVKAPPQPVPESAPTSGLARNWLWIAVAVVALAALAIALASA
jgi:hypothetical protein